MKNKKEKKINLDANYFREIVAITCTNLRETVADFFRWIIEKLVVWKSKSVVNLVEMRNISLVSLLFKFLWRFFPVQNSNDKENRKKSLENVWKTDFWDYWKSKFFKWIYLIVLTCFLLLNLYIFPSNSTIEEN